MSYSAFANYYDHLMKDVNYPALAQYLRRVLAQFGHTPELALDLACGTGSLTLELKQMGIDIYGIDASPDMLSIAQQKAAAAGEEILFLCQKMQNLDLYGTIDTVFCTLDSLNHLSGKKELLKAFQKVSLFLEPNGYFIFDLNTPYKHQHVLSDHTFVYDLDPIYCVWQNFYEERENRVSISLDFFEREEQVYRRSHENFYEYAYSIDDIRSLLEQSGLQMRAVYEDCTFNAPTNHTERILVVSEKSSVKNIEKVIDK